MWGSKVGPNGQFREVLWAEGRHNPRLDAHSGALWDMATRETSNEREEKCSAATAETMFLLDRHLLGPFANISPSSRDLSRYKNTSNFTILGPVFTQDGDWGIDHRFSSHGLQLKIFLADDFPADGGRYGPLLPHMKGSGLFESSPNDPLCRQPRPHDAPALVESLPVTFDPSPFYDHKGRVFLSCIGSWKHCLSLYHL